MCSLEGESGTKRVSALGREGFGAKAPSSGRFHEEEGFPPGDHADRLCRKATHGLVILTSE